MNIDILSLSSAKPAPVDYPLTSFPDDVAQSIQDVCKALSLPVQFVGTSALWTISSLAGARYVSDFNGGGKNILFCLLVAPVSVGKTPAFNVCCDKPLKEAYKYVDAEFAQRYQQWQERDKTDNSPRPKRYVPIVKDATTEGIIHKHMSQPHGMGVYYDEAESIFGAGTYKGTNDAITFYTTAFNGDRYGSIRADDEKERVLPYTNINLLMGTQPERLNHVFTQDRISSGFASRFLIVSADYQLLNISIDPFSESANMGPMWKERVEFLFYQGYNNQPIVCVEMPDASKDIYKKYYRDLLAEANTRIINRQESYLIGTEAKLSNYFPRLCMVLSIMFNPENPILRPDIVHKAFDLYRYYQQSSITAITGMKIQVDTGLSPELTLLYERLPNEFNAKDADLLGATLGLGERKFKSAMRVKDFAALFTKPARGFYSKL
jgi:hypothetical protein